MRNNGLPIGHIRDYWYYVGVMVDDRGMNVMKNEFTTDELKTIRYLIALHMHMLREWSRQDEPYYAELEKLTAKVGRKLAGWELN